MKTLQNRFKPIRIKRSTEITLELNGQPEGNYILTSCLHSIEELKKALKYKIDITHESGEKYTLDKPTFGNRLCKWRPVSKIYGVYLNENMLMATNIIKEAGTCSIALNGCEISEII